MKLTKIIAVVVIWRLVLTAIAGVAPRVLPYQPSFPYTDTILEPLGHKLLYSWANFDGVHYLTIIAKGYMGTGSIQAFFPLYPMLIKGLTYLLINPIVSGILLSSFCLAVALYYLYKLVITDYSSVIASRLIWLLLLFPTALFFTALYTESLFLLLSVLCFYFARKKQFLPAALMAGLASATRITGILLLPALIIEICQTRSKLSPPILVTKLIGYGAVAASGLVAYMAYLAKFFGDPLLFLHVQSLFGAGRQTDKLIFLPQVFWRYLKMLITVNPQSLVYYSIVSEFILALLFLVLVILAFKHTRLSYAVYALLSYLLPTLTGTFSSLPRYVLVLFPAFIVLAKLTPKKYLPIILTSSGILLVINTILFIQGYWVA